jgi:hypothetical protein
MTITLAAAMRDQRLLGGPFKAPTFWPWHAVAKLLSGETLDERESMLFQECTGRARLPTKPVLRLTLLSGRRGGKDRWMSAVAVHRAALAADWGSIMSPGEQAVVLLLGADRKQAAILRRYCEGLLRAPLLAKEMVRSTDDVIEFRNGAVLEIATNDARLVRGRSAIAVLGSETCFWRTDTESASSDEEVVAAAEPSMAMCGDGGLLILASSVYRKRGFMFRKWKELHGNEDAEDICWLAASRTMNPALPEAVVQKAMANDPARARAEFLSQWREDLTDFLPADVIDGATDFGVRERAPQPHTRFVCYVDAAGGTGLDSFALAIAHLEPDGTVMLDCVRERKPRFVPAAVIEEFSQLVQTYGISEVRGDKFAGSFHADEWRRSGITYRPAATTTSENYLAALPLLLAGKARLLDDATLRQQLAGLERRAHANGRESVSHGSAMSAHDDVAAVCCGALVLARPRSVFIPQGSDIGVVQVGRGSSNPFAGEGGVSPDFVDATPHLF